MTKINKVNLVPTLTDSTLSTTSSNQRSRLVPRRPRHSLSHAECSLPLKKRRFFTTIFSSSHSDDVVVVDEEQVHEDGISRGSTWLESESPSLQDTKAINERTMNIASPSLPPIWPSPSFDKTEDERTAALALISASTPIYSDPLTPKSPRPTFTFNQGKEQDDDPIAAAIAIAHLSTPRQHRRDKGDLLGYDCVQFPRHGFVSTVSPLPTNSVESSPAGSLSSSSLSSQGELKNSCVEEDCSMSGKLSTKRSNYDRFVNPLPNGCHGRTSRYDSYCRRQPCYNGSHYCKLHYQQHIKNQTLADETGDIKRMPSPSSLPRSNGLNESRATSVVVMTNKTKQEQGPSLQANLVPIFKSTNTSKVGQQDKRFTGTDGEVRCQATTTRGRACAYVAVEYSKYCHLHSDFDTNPPPRRNKAALIASTRSLVQHGDRVVVVVNKSTSSIQQGAKMYCLTNDLNSGKGVELDNSELVDSNDSTSFPLLSMLSTNQWYNKRVIISTGPFMNRVGRVLRWGNGWVSVQVEPAGDTKIKTKKEDVIHNRRSFELFLHPNQEEDKYNI